MNRQIIASAICFFLGCLAFCQPLLCEGMFSKITGIKSVNGNGKTCFTIVSGTGSEGRGQNCLVKSMDGCNEVICLEEDFDLGSDEITDVVPHEKYGNSLFVLYTSSCYFYLLFCNPMGPLVLKKIQSGTECPVDAVNVSFFTSNEIMVTYFSAGTIYAALLSISENLESTDNSETYLGEYRFMDFRTIDDVSYVIVRTKKDDFTLYLLLACSKDGIRKIFESESSYIVSMGFVDGIEKDGFHFYCGNWIYFCNGNQVSKEVEFLHGGMIDLICSVKNCGENLFIVKETMQSSGKKISLYDRQNVVYESEPAEFVKIAICQDKCFFLFSRNGSIEEYELMSGSDRLSHAGTYTDFELVHDSNSLLPYLQVKKISDHSLKIVDPSFKTIVDGFAMEPGVLDFHAFGMSVALNDGKNLFLYDGEKWNVHSAGSLTSFTETVNGVKFISFVENGSLNVVSLEKKYE